MNNTLEAINHRITKVEEWISELEDRMAEITAAKQNIEKRMKTAQGASETTLNAPTFTL